MRLSLSHLSSKSLKKVPPTMDEPMPQDRSLLTPSSSDQFSAAQHNKLNEEITQVALVTLNGQLKLKSIIECATLLSIIVRRSEGKLRDTYTNIENAISIVRAKPNLKIALQEAWEKGDYREIRRSELLTVSKLKERETQKTIIEKAWTTQYKGIAHQALLSRIQNIMKDSHLYARFLAIIQSSGTGKSRLIEELSRECHGLPWGFPGKPAPAPVETHTRSHGHGF